MGLISGTPTTAGSYGPELSATNGYGTGVGYAIWQVDSASPPVISSALSAEGATGTPFSYQIAVSFQSAPPTSYGATSLPAGLSLNPSTGLISGTPTVEAGTYGNLTISATNPPGTDTESFTVTIDPGPPTITSAATAAAAQGAASSYQITATASPTGYGATGLPAGLTINTSTGLLSGTPTAAGIATITLSATNGNGNCTATLTLTVNASAPWPSGSKSITVPSTAVG